MKGLLGAATVMGTLMYGAGHVWAGHANFFLHDHDLCHSPPDEAFIDMLKQNCCLAGPHFPPPAIVEVLQDYVTNFHKVRRCILLWWTCGVVVLPMAMHWTVLSSLAIWCGRKEMSGRMSSWILPRVTHSSWMKSLLFAHWVCNTSVTHLHWSCS